MLRSFMSRVSLPVLLLVAVPLSNACSSEPASNQESNTGTLSMPLITSVNDHLYRLRGNIEIYGERYSDWIYTSDETVLTRSLPAGEYVAYLYGYELDRFDEGSGEWVRVGAQLVSDNAQYFVIHHQATTTIAFAFETDGILVTVGAGQLVIDVSVSEVPPVCTILGDDCEYEGTWCAPPALTGRPLACIYAGDTEPGASCTAPEQCTANSSCFDFGEGDGPVCAALCEPEDFGEACIGGGTCTEADASYGVCVPEGGTLPDYGNGEGGSGGGGTGGMGASGGSAGKGGGGKGGGKGGSVGGGPATGGTGAVPGAGGSGAFPGTGGVSGFGGASD
jgi:hypothetical protein